MKNSQVAVYLIAGFFVSLVFLVGCVSQQQAPTGRTNANTPAQNLAATTVPQSDEVNSDLSQIRAEIKEEIHRINDSIFFTKWEFNTTSNVVNLYAINIRNECEIKGFQGKKYGNYSVYIVHDTEFEKDMADVQQQLVQLSKNPIYHISATPMTLDTFHDPPQNYVDLLVEEITPENKKLNDTVIKGWKIFVHQISSPPQTIIPRTTTITGQVFKDTNSSALKLPLEIKQEIWYSSSSLNIDKW